MRGFFIPSRLNRQAMAREVIPRASLRYATVRLSETSTMSVQKNKLRVLFIGKAENIFAKIAADFIQQHFDNPIIVFSKREDPFPEKLLQWKGDLLISYLAQWVIPGGLINSAKLAAFNLHPGPPEYPGIGCTNFAIYNDEKIFGITCHHMLDRVDSGQIIAVRRFPVFETDSVYSLTQRCYVEILHLFEELISGIIRGEALPVSSESWKRKPYKRKELDALCQLTDDMKEEEVQKRIKATTYGDKVWAYRVTEKVQA